MKNKELQNQRNKGISMIYQINSLLKSSIYGGSTDKSAAMQILLVSVKALKDIENLQ